MKKYELRFAPAAERRAGVGRIFAVVLTYNRKELVSLCLSAIFAQTRQPDGIIVLDNASTDGTADMLESAGYLDRPGFSLYRAKVNSGPAGGFSELFRIAYEEGADWIWAMDDDVIASETALADLLSGLDHLPPPSQFAFLLSKAVGSDGNANEVPVIDQRVRGGGCPQWAEFLEHGMIRIRESSLVSILVPRATVRDFGVPRSDFFYGGEDGDFTLRATEDRPAYMVSSSIVTHLRKAPGDLAIFNESNPARLSNFWYLQRNRIWLDRTYYPRRVFLWQFLRGFVLAARCLRSPDHRLRRMWIILGGTLAGLVFQPRTNERHEGVRSDVFWRHTRQEDESSEIQSAAL
jgi:GT2 family glycosyltransferase